MNAALWIVQVLLAAFFLFAGVLKLTQPREKLAAGFMKWTEDFSAGSVRTIGVLEVMGAVGLVLPALTGVLPWLTPLAAVGLALTMAGGAATHARRGRPSP